MMIYLPSPQIRLTNFFEPVSVSDIRKKGIKVYLNGMSASKEFIL